MCFYTERFGKCEVICHFREIALVKLEKNYEKYIVTIGLSIENKNWLNGIYCNNIKEAEEIFSKYVKDFYMVSFKI